MKHLLPMNLQFFSEEVPKDGQVAGSEADTSTVEGTEGEQQEEKPDDPPPRMYSDREYQAQSVKQFSAGITKAMKEAGFDGSTEDDFKKNLKAFKEWQNAQLSEAEKQAKALGDANAAAADAQAKLVKYEQADAVRQAGVIEKHVRYVAFEASEMATAENIDFAAAVERFLEAHKDQYTTGPNETPPPTHQMKVTTGGKKQGEQEKNDFDFSHFAKF